MKFWRNILKYTYSTLVGRTDKTHEIILIKETCPFDIWKKL